MAQLIDLIVDRGILLNIGIRRRHIRLRLIVIIIGDKVLHRIVREKLFHLRIKLCRQRLIVSDHQRRLIELLDHIRHRKRLTGSGHAKQRLKLIPLFKSLHQLLDRLRLISGGLVF